MGSLLQRVDRGVAAAEAVERDPYTERQRDEALFELVEGDPGVVVGDLDHQRPRGQAVPGEERLDGAERHRPVQQSAGGQPDGHGDLVPGPGPVGGLLDGLFQEPAAELRGAVAVLGDAEEFGGGEQDALGGAPAGLRGDGGDGAGGEMDHGLMEQGELAVPQGGAQPGRQFGPAYHFGLHLRGVQLDAVSFTALARYMARSALRMRSVGVMAGSAKATPMEAATRTSPPPIR